MQVMLLYKV